jgi:hypothetical protein
MPRGFELDLIRHKQKAREQIHHERQRQRNELTAHGRNAREQKTICNETKQQRF